MAVKRTPLPRARHHWDGHGQSDPATPHGSQHEWFLRSRPGCGRVHTSSFGGHVLLHGIRLCDSHPHLLGRVQLGGIRD